jgi:hypothetical protein
MKSYKINENTELTYDPDYNDWWLASGKAENRVHILLSKRDLLKLNEAIQEIITGEHIEIPTKDR